MTHVIDPGDDLDALQAIGKVQPVARAVAVDLAEGGLQGELMFVDANTNPPVASLGKDQKMRLRTLTVVHDGFDPDHLRGKLPKRSSVRHAYPAVLQDRVIGNPKDYGDPAPEQSSQGGNGW